MIYFNSKTANIDRMLFGYADYKSNKQGLLVRGNSHILTDK